MSDRVPHVWVQVDVPACALSGRPRPAEVVCGCCGTRILASQVPVVDRVPGYSDCHELLAVIVMET